MNCCGYVLDVCLLLFDDLVFMLQGVAVWALVMVVIVFRGLVFLLLWFVGQELLCGRVLFLWFAGCFMM